MNIKCKCKFISNDGAMIYGFIIDTGINYEELRDGVGHYTTIIAMDCTGKMHMVPVHNVYIIPNNTENHNYREYKRIFG